MKQHTVLFVVAQGDPYGILRDGLCGASPPRVTNAPGGWYWCEGDNTLVKDRVREGWYPSDQRFYGIPGPHAGEDIQHALVLVWEGTRVQEGFDRLHDRLRTAQEKMASSLEHPITPFTYIHQGLSAEAVLGKCAQQLRLGRLLCLDDNGQDVTP